MSTQKVLVSPGFGAGWSTWSEKPKEVAEYRPIIEYIEAGGDPQLLTKDNELVKQMVEDLELSFFFCGGAHDLCVQEVYGPYRIKRIRWK